MTFTVRLAAPSGDGVPVSPIALGTGLRFIKCLFANPGTARPTEQECGRM